MLLRLGQEFGLIPAARTRVETDPLAATTTVTRTTRWPEALGGVPAAFGPLSAGQHVLSSDSQGGPHLVAPLAFTGLELGRPRAHWAASCAACVSA